MANEVIGSLIGATVGGISAGPSGIVVGSMVGGILAPFFPGWSDITSDLLGELGADGVKAGARFVWRRLTPEIRQLVHDDLQEAFQDAFREAVYDMGGVICFPEERRYRRSTEADRHDYGYLVSPLEQRNALLASELCATLKELAQLSTNSLPVSADAPIFALSATNSFEELNQLFVEAVLIPFFRQYQSLSEELRVLGDIYDLEQHLQRHLLRRILVHLGEHLKQRPEAWRAFNRLLLDTVLATLQQGVQQLGAGQASLIEEVQRVSQGIAGLDFDAWSGAITNLIIQLGQMKTEQSVRWDELQQTLGAHHGEDVSWYKHLDAKLDVVVRQTASREETQRRIPTVSTVPAPPAKFTGRRSLLSTLKKELASDQPGPHVALQGMAGIGKSATARKLASELKGHFKGSIFWAALADRGGNPQQILRTWARICGYELSGEVDESVLIQLTRDLLASRRVDLGPAMVMLDDVRPEWVDAARLVMEALPEGIPILITTRSLDVASSLGMRVFSLTRLAPREAMTLLKAHAGSAVIKSEISSAVELLETIGHLPLAVELAGKNLAVVARKPGKNVERLRQEIKRRAEDVLSLPGHPGLAATFSVTYDALPTEVQRLFRWIGAFTARPLYLSSVASIANLGEREVEDLLDRLVETALLDWGEVEGTYVLHPLLHQYARQLLDKTDEAEEAKLRHFSFHLEQAQATAQVDIIARYGIRFDQPETGQVSPEEAKAIYATLTGFSRDFQGQIRALEEAGEISMARVCYVVNHGLWTREQVEMIVTGSEQPESVLRGWATALQRHQFYHDLLHARAALLGGMLDRILSERDQSLDIQFNGIFYAKVYRSKETILIPWLYPDARRLEIEGGQSFNVLVRARDEADILLHLSEDIKHAETLRIQTQRPTFVLLPQDFFSLPHRFQEQFCGESELVGLSLLISPDSVRVFDAEAFQRLSRSQVLRR